MRIIVQNVIKASVTIDNEIYSSIGKGYLLLVSFTHDDNKEIIDKLIHKLINLRVFVDENGKTNLSLKDVNGSILSVSQFTLYADIRHGNRPSFVNYCLNSKDAKELYEYFNKQLKFNNIDVKEGVFGADMKVELINDGPFTIIMDSKELM